ncbi:hypothetical protein LSAT2_002262 [Lamellibrachia satsuma]|nr:hypothetical protein LSAT2_002262 [Lamellibrachia satsuma]
MIAASSKVRVWAGTVSALGCSAIVTPPVTGSRLASRSGAGVSPTRPTSRPRTRMTAWMRTRTPSRPTVPVATGVVAVTIKRVYQEKQQPEGHQQPRRRQHFVVEHSAHTTRNGRRSFTHVKDDSVPWAKSYLGGIVTKPTNNISTSRVLTRWRTSYKSYVTQVADEYLEVC